MWGSTDQAIVGRGRIIQPRPRGQTARWFLVGVAAQSAYVSVYVNAARDGQYLLRSDADRLGRVKLGPAAITIRISTISTSRRSTNCSLTPISSPAQTPGDDKEAYVLDDLPEIPHADRSLPGTLELGAQRGS
jgi:hypothetical protein